MGSDGYGSFFISYAHGVSRDEGLCAAFAEALAAAGHEVFFDRKLRLGADWEVEIQRQLDRCGFFLLLLSEPALDSALVLQEVERACGRCKRQGAPVVLTVRIQLERELPYRWAAALSGYQWVSWKGEADFDSILRSIRSLVESVDVPPPPPLPARRRWLHWLGGGALIAAGMAVTTVGSQRTTTCVLVPSYAMQTIAASEVAPARISASERCDPEHYYCIDITGVGRFPLPPNGVLIGARPPSLEAIASPEGGPMPAAVGSTFLEPAQFQWPFFKRPWGPGSLCESGSIRLLKGSPTGQFAPCPSAAAVRCERIEEVRRCRVSAEGC